MVRPYAEVARVLLLVLYFPKRCGRNDCALPHPIHRSGEGVQVIFPDLLYYLGMLKFICHHGKHETLFCLNKLWEGRRAATFPHWKHDLSRARCLICLFLTYEIVSPHSGGGAQQLEDGPP